MIFVKHLQNNKKMESFKFVVEPIKDKKKGLINESLDSYLKVDIFTMIQYFCLMFLMEDKYNNYKLDRPSFNDDDYPISPDYINSKTFQINLTRYLASTLGENFDDTLNPEKYSDDTYERSCLHSPEDFIDNVEYELVSHPDKFDKFIEDIYEINEYNALYLGIIDNIGFYKKYDKYYAIPGKTREYYSSNGIMFMLNDVLKQEPRSSWWIKDVNKDVEEDIIQAIPEKLIPIINYDSLVQQLINEYRHHLINNKGIIDNTMSENIVYTSDPEITKQVIKNNMKIISDTVKNLEKKSHKSLISSNKKKLMELLTPVEN